MNNSNERTEQLLRKSPRLAVPANLLATLKAEIRLPSGETRSQVQSHTPSLLRRWLPALAFTVWLMACLIILAVQTNVLTRLRTENQALRAANSEIQKATPSAAELNQQQAGNNDLEKLRADNLEVQKLRWEVTQLQEQLRELEILRAQNQQLLSELKSRPGQPPQPGQDFFTVAKQRSSSINCISNLKQIGLAARMWANDHGDMLAADYESLKAYLGSSKVLYCPESEGTVQYEIVSPGISELDATVVYARCPTHGHVVLADGSAHQLGDRKLTVRTDGKVVIGK